MKESGFWSELREGLSSEVASTRVENTVAQGMPDVNACRRGTEVWIELKMMKSGRLKLRHSQINWMMRRVQMAKQRNVFVAARAPNQIHIWKATTILPVAYQKQRMLAPTRADRVTQETDGVVFVPPVADFSVTMLHPMKYQMIEKFLFGV